MPNFSSREWEDRFHEMSWMPSSGATRQPNRCRVHPIERSAYLLGTRKGVVPRRKQIVCVGEFRATQLPDYFRLIREQGSQ